MQVRKAIAIAVVAAAPARSFVPGGASARGLSSVGSRAFSRPLASVQTPSLGGGIKHVRMLFGGLSTPFLRKEMNYDTLLGSAKEAATAALAGKVPSKSEQGYDIATFAGGCFWGLELAMQRVPGVISTHVGYTQGPVLKPTYEAVCSGSTGHTEAVQVYYDANEVGYKELVQVFFDRIDPTQVNGQGGDWGTQYRTGVYPHTPEQEAIAKEVAAAVSQKYQKPLATEIKSAEVFWPAEEYHHQYLEKGGRAGSKQSAEKGCTDKIRCYG